MNCDGDVMCGCAHCVISHAEEKLADSNAEYFCMGGPQCGCPRCEIEEAERELAENKKGGRL